eukprot:1530910-Pyramimonas_sp.AAC.1
MSDHAAVMTSISARSISPPSERQISKFIFALPFFKKRLMGMVEDGDRAIEKGLASYVCRALQGHA